MAQSLNADDFRTPDGNSTDKFDIIFEFVGAASSGLLLSYRGAVGRIWREESYLKQVGALQYSQVKYLLVRIDWNRNWSVRVGSVEYRRHNGDDRAAFSWNDLNGLDRPLCALNVALSLL